MVIKALLKNGVIEALEPLTEIEDGVVEVEVRKYVSDKNVVNQTKGSINLSKDLVIEIAESEEILNENF